MRLASGGHGDDAELRVLWLIKGLGAGGAERLLVAHARERAPDIHPSVAITRPDRAHLRAEIEQLDVPVIELAQESARPLTWTNQLAELLRSGRFDLVHVHSPALAPAARLIGRRRGVPVVYTEHNRWAQYRLPTRLANAATYPLDTHRFAVSAGVKASVGLPWRRKVEVLLHGIDLDQRPEPGTRERLRSSLGIAPDEVTVLVVANLRTEKAPFDFIEAVASVPRSVAVRFLWAGQGPLEAAFERAIAASGQQDRLQFLGYRTDISDLMAAADIFCLSSHHEGLPVAVMEAMAAGLPIVATEVGGLPEAINGAEPCGVLVPARRPAQLGDALHRLIVDGDRRHQLGQASLTASARFDAKRAIGRIESVYREVI